jgi:hypothetical protein
MDIEPGEETKASSVKLGGMGFENATRRVPPSCAPEMPVVTMSGEQPGTEAGAEASSETSTLAFPASGADPVFERRQRDAAGVVNERHKVGGSRIARFNLLTMGRTMNKTGDHHWSVDTKGAVGRKPLVTRAYLASAFRL